MANRREKKYLSHGRIQSLTRKHEHEALLLRKNAELADLVAARLEPMIKAEVEAQLKDLYSREEYRRAQLREAQEKLIPEPGDGETP